jgi:hypothetical protein
VCGEEEIVTRCSKLKRTYEFLFQIAASLPIFCVRIFSGILLASIGLIHSIQAGIQRAVLVGFFFLCFSLVVGGGRIIAT